jgi:hypothetical protein
MYHRRSRGGAPFVIAIMALVATVMLVQAVISAILTLGAILGIVGGIALAFPAVRAMLGRRLGPHPLSGIGALAKVVRR